MASTDGLEGSQTKVKWSPAVADVKKKIKICSEQIMELPECMNTFLHALEVSKPFNGHAFVRTFAATHDRSRSWCLSHMGSSYAQWEGWFRVGLQPRYLQAKIKQRPTDIMCYTRKLAVCRVRVVNRVGPVWPCWIELLRRYYGRRTEKECSGEEYIFYR